MKKKAINKAADTLTDVCSGTSSSRAPSSVPIREFVMQSKQISNDWSKKV
jgi:hypothetical protein